MTVMGGASSAVEDDYARLAARRAGVIGLTCVALTLSGLLDLATGPAFLPLASVTRSILGLGAERSVDAIVWTIRLPVAGMAVVVGAALGLSGGLMQTILNNPLASSYTLGVSAGAGFGAALVIVAGAALPLPETYALPASAFLFASLTCVLVWLIAEVQGTTPETLVLAGIALLFLFQALLSLLQFVASPEALQQIVFWLFGSLQKATCPKLAVVAVVVVICVPVVAWDAWRLTALKLGDERAAGLGVDVRRVRLRAFTVVAALTGASVAFVGTIGFVGLVAPHVARMLVGEDQRAFLPASTLFGALLLSLSSVASKAVLPGAVFPIGILTSLIGVPFFIWLVLGSRRRFW